MFAPLQDVCIVRIGSERGGSNFIPKGEGVVGWSERWEIVEDNIPTGFKCAPRAVGVRYPYMIAFGVSCISQKTARFAMYSKFGKRVR
jgi:hypothetical protein